MSRMSILPWSVDDVEAECEQLGKGLQGGEGPLSTLIQPCSPEFRDVIRAEPIPERPSQIFRRFSRGPTVHPTSALFFSLTCIFILSDDFQFWHDSSRHRTRTDDPD